MHSNGIHIEAESFDIDASNFPATTFDSNVYFIGPTFWHNFKIPINVFYIPQGFIINPLNSERKLICSSPYKTAFSTSSIAPVFVYEAYGSPERQIANLQIEPTNETSIVFNQNIAPTVDKNTITIIQKYGTKIIYNASYVPFSQTQTNTEVFDILLNSPNTTIESLQVGVPKQINIFKTNDDPMTVYIKSLFVQNSGTINFIGKNFEVIVSGPISSDSLSRKVSFLGDARVRFLNSQLLYVNVYAPHLVLDTNYLFNFTTYANENSITAENITLIGNRTLYIHMPHDSLTPGLSRRKLICARNLDCSRFAINFPGININGTSNDSYVSGCLMVNNRRCFEACRSEATGNNIKTTQFCFANDGSKCSSDFTNVATVERMINDMSKDTHTLSIEIGDFQPEGIVLDVPSFPSHENIEIIIMSKTSTRFPTCYFTARSFKPGTVKYLYCSGIDIKIFDPENTGERFHVPYMLLINTSVDDFATYFSNSTVETIVVTTMAIDMTKYCRPKFLKLYDYSLKNLTIKYKKNGFKIGTYRIYLDDSCRFVYHRYIEDNLYINNQNYNRSAKFSIFTGAPVFITGKWDIESISEIHVIKATYEPAICLLSTNIPFNIQCSGIKNKNYHLTINVQYNNTVVHSLKLYRYSLNVYSELQRPHHLIIENVQIFGYLKASVDLTRVRIHRLDLFEDSVAIFSPNFVNINEVEMHHGSHLVSGYLPSNVTMHYSLQKIPLIEKIMYLYHGINHLKLIHHRLYNETYIYNRFPYIYDNLSVPLITGLGNTLNCTWDLEMESVDDSDFAGENRIFLTKTNGTGVYFYRREVFKEYKPDETCTNAIIVGCSLCGLLIFAMVLAFFFARWARKTRLEASLKSSSLMDSLVSS